MLDQAGIGELALGYLGGVLDAATGLIYVGRVLRPGHWTFLVAGYELRRAQPLRALARQPAGDDRGATGAAGSRAW